jgi:Uma2 family endonuclease
MNATHPTRIAFGPRAPLTDRLFLRLCGANPELRLERTAQGELIVMTPAGAEAGGREAVLVHLLMAWNDAHALGVVFGPSAGFALPNGAIRSPDVSWIARDRWDALPPQRRRRFAPLCPDFVAELRSPTDRRRDLRTKMREYRACGARLGWLIDPTRRVVEVYRPGADRVTLTDPATLPGEDVLPGFMLELKAIFDWS